MRLFLDANVLFTAAHNPRGKAALVIELGGGDGPWEVVTSALAAAEARRNLCRRFPGAVGRLAEVLRRIPLVSPPPPYNCPMPLAEKDRPILHAAAVAGASHLLTGDLKHFGPYMSRPQQTRNIMIQTVADFLDSVVAP